MEIRFQSDLDFQIDAVNSIVDLFKTQKFRHETIFMIPENGTIPNSLDIHSDQDPFESARDSETK